MWQVVPLCKAILTPELKKLTPAELVLDAGGGMQRPPCLTYSEDLLDLLEDLLVHCAECVSVGRVAPSGDRASCALEVLALGVLGKGVEELSRLDVRLLKCLGESD